jgi:hypothetical protein
LTTFIGWTKIYDDFCQLSNDMADDMVLTWHWVDGVALMWHLAYGMAIMWHGVHGHTFHLPNEDTYIPNEKHAFPMKEHAFSQVFCWHGNIHFLEHDNPN